MRRGLYDALTDNAEQAVNQRSMSPILFAEGKRTPTILIEFR